MTVRISSLNARRALQTLGRNIKKARGKRRISIKGFAERIGVSESTVIRLEKGDDGVSIGTLAMACLVLGELERVSDFLDPGSDDTGLQMEQDTLPKRIDGARKVKDRSAVEIQSDPPLGSDDEGVGF